jgi:ArsR family metal-binding transcriptional regulator
MNEYNTQRNPLILKEYGRNVQMLVDYLMEIEDMDKRNASAKALVDLMKQINPAVKEGSEDTQKLWDDLFIMSDFKLEIDSPFPKPDKDLLLKKPDVLGYRDKKIMFKHYGLNIQLMVDHALTLEDPKDQEDAVIYIGRLMKSFASIWNKDNLDDAVILHNIRDLSGGKLDIDLDKVRENNLFNNLVREKPKSYSNNNDRDRDRGRNKRPRRKRS